MTDFDVFNSHVEGSTAKGNMYSNIPEDGWFIYSGVREITLSGGYKGYIGEVNYKFDSAGVNEDLSKMVQTITSENDEFTLWNETLEYIFDSLR